MSSAVGLRVAAVQPGSLAAELGLGPGAELRSVNGRELRDFLDWEFLSAEPAFVLRARLPDGEEVVLDVERGGVAEGRPLGVTLEPPKIRRCANRCDFCFVDGNPVAARASLLIRDDDYRLSFRHGSFATLSNLAPRDLERILEYRLSPLYVSVHATDPDVRRRLLRNPKAPAILPQLRMLGAGGIRFHAQIVLVPPLNDGMVLERSLADLYALGGLVLSVAVVPVALTAFSRHDVVRTPRAEEAGAALRTVRRRAARARGERRAGWVYGSDELYLLAGEPLPPPQEYDGFPQVENGVGAVAYLKLHIARERERLPRLDAARILVCTGTAMGPLMPAVLGDLAERTGGRFELLVLENSYYGASVTTAGLLPGAAFRAALAGREGYDLALLPAEAVSEDGRFIDDLTLEALETSVPVPVRPSYDFADALGEAAVVR